MPFEKYERASQRMNKFEHDFYVINNKVKVADYEIDDMVELRDESGKIDVTIVARLDEHRVNADSGKSFTEPLFFGRFGKEVVRFYPKHVIRHKKGMRRLQIEIEEAENRLAEAKKRLANAKRAHNLRTWLTSGSMSSDSEAESDADPPESAAMPEPSGEAVPAGQAPPAPMLRRRCDRPGWKPRGRPWHFN